MTKSDDVEEDVGDGKPKEDINCMTERLRLRSGKKPSYAEEDVVYDEVDSESEAGSTDYKEVQAKKKKPKVAYCSVCNTGEKLIFCSTCSSAYHLGCLNPPLKVNPRGKWKCPQCVDPLGDIDKFLDCQMRPLVTLNTPQEDEATVGPSSQLLTRQYLVKWKSKSYLHCSWIAEAELEKAIKAFSGLKMKLNYFRRQIESSKGWNFLEEEWVPIRSEWTTVEKVLDCRQTFGVKEYLVKWKDLGYEDVTWEVEKDIAPFQAQVDRFNLLRNRRPGPTPKKRKGSALDNRETKRRRKEFKAYEETPKFLPGGILHHYQLEGLNFLRFAWQQEKHVILADEMGLGKTVQSIAFLASLMEEGVSLPHLVVAPLSTLRNWEREFTTWAPHMNTVLYAGPSAARAVIR
eukprot:c3912_g1_i1 orf=833-2041(+)